MVKLLSTRTIDKTELFKSLRDNGVCEIVITTDSIPKDNNFDIIYEMVSKPNVYVCYKRFFLNEEFYNISLKDIIPTKRLSSLKAEIESYYKDDVKQFVDEYVTENKFYSVSKNITGMFANFTYQLYLLEDDKDMKFKSLTVIDNVLYEAMNKGFSTDDNLKIISKLKKVYP